MEKRENKLFMDNPRIYAGWLDLNINNDITIPVSYLNSHFFYDILSIINVLGSSIETFTIPLEIDCEGYFVTLKFQCLNYDEVVVYVYKEDEGDILKGLYKIGRHSLIWELIELVEKNYELYNKDFCCGDIADQLLVSCINSAKKSLLWIYKKKEK